MGAFVTDRMFVARHGDKIFLWESRGTETADSGGWGGRVESTCFAGDFEAWRTMISDVVVAADEPVHVVVAGGAVFAAVAH